MLFFAFHIRSYIKEKRRKLPKPSRKPAEKTAVAKIKKKDAGRGKEKVDEAAIPAAEEAPQHLSTAATAAGQVITAINDPSEQRAIFLQISAVEADMR